MASFHVESVMVKKLGKLRHVGGFLGTSEVQRRIMSKEVFVKANHSNFNNL